MLCTKFGLKQPSDSKEEDKYKVYENNNDHEGPNFAQKNLLELRWAK